MVISPNQNQAESNKSPVVNYLYQELISVGVEAADWQEVLTLLANRLFQAGYVRESYLQAVLDRESQFPTGLRTAEVAVALPHAEKEHVLKPAVAVAILAHPVTFGEMGTEDQTVPVEIVFMLSILEPDEQVTWLSRLVSTFQLEGFLPLLKSSADSATAYQHLLDALEFIRLAEEED
ncbi:MAG: PTS sugar transporter subunit IIA [Pelolinea sp.]|nr:PTS sugar transporter subunit IIA [Pelolinea sp.]